MIDMLFSRLFSKEAFLLFAAACIVVALGLFVSEAIDELRRGKYLYGIVLLLLVAWLIGFMAYHFSGLRL